MTVGYLLAMVYPDTEVSQPVLQNPHLLWHIRTNAINRTCEKGMSIVTKPKSSVLGDHSAMLIVFPPSTELDAWLHLLFI